MEYQNLSAVASEKQSVVDAPSNIPIISVNTIKHALRSVADTKGCTQRGKKFFPHPFPARMPLEVAKAAIEGFTLPGHTVLDPMAGSGIVLYAAQLAGRHALGRDIDPLAVSLGRTICLNKLPPDFLQLSEKILRRAQQIFKIKSFSSERLQLLSIEDRKFLRYWFPNKAVLQMFALADAVNELVSKSNADIYKVLLSSLVISRGSGASRAMDLSRSRPHRVDTKIPRMPFDSWSRKTKEFDQYYNERSPTSLKADVKLGDARHLDIEDESIDAIITSPPYVNAIDYIRTSKFSLIFFGHELADLRSIRTISMGTQKGLKQLKVPALETLLKERVSDLKRLPILRRYIQDMYDALREAKRVLKPGGRALYVVGPSILSRRDYDGGDVLGRIAQIVGLEVIACARRDLNSNRRSLPPPLRNKRSASIHQRMTCELYIALVKPNHERE